MHLGEALVAVKGGREKGPDEVQFHGRQVVQLHHRHGALDSGPKQLKLTLHLPVTNRLEQQLQS